MTWFDDLHSLRSGVTQCVFSIDWKVVECGMETLDFGSKKRRDFVPKPPFWNSALFRSNDMHRWEYCRIKNRSLVLLHYILFYYLLGIRFLLSLSLHENLFYLVENCNRIFNIVRAAVTFSSKLVHIHLLISLTLTYRKFWSNSNRCSMLEKCVYIL